MSLTSAFFDAELVGGVYDRVYSAERFAEYFAAFIANGVFPDPATNLQVVANVPRDMTVLVKSGLGWINGYYCNNDGNYPLTISPASGTLPRVDAVVLRWSRSNRSISLEVKTGVATSSPSAPSLERSADNYELMLASIEVVAGATSIAQANITDKRPDSSVCGWVKGVVDQVDTTNLFAQYDAAFQEWFDNIKSQLSGDIATNLQNQIDRNAANIAVINATTLKEDTKTALGLPISAGPDDAFKVLARVGNLHVWKFTDSEGNVTFPTSDDAGAHTEGEVNRTEPWYEVGGTETNVKLISLTSNSTGCSFYYADSFSVNDDGEVVLVNPTSSPTAKASIWVSDYATRSILNGKYVKVISPRDGQDTETVYYLPSGFSFSYSNGLVASKAQRVTGYPATQEGEFTYLGQLGDGARIEVGSYVGTGTYGKENLMSLNVGKNCVKVEIRGRYSASRVSSSYLEICPQIATSKWSDQAYYVNGTMDQNSFMKIVDGVLYWYSKSADGQGNFSGYEYKYTIYKK